MAIFLWILLIAVCGTVAWGAWSFAPWVPTREVDIERMLALAGDVRGKTFVELGSGDGRATLAAARHGAMATGYEIAAPLFLIAWLRGKLAGSSARFVMKDFFQVDLRDVDILFFYGTPRPIAEKLRTKLEKELRPGTQVYSYMFEIEGWKPERTDTLTRGTYPLYRYLRPEHK